MRLLASNLLRKTLVSGAMEELLLHVDALVRMGWRDNTARNTYLGKFKNLTNAHARKVLQQPVVRETVIQAVELAAYFRGSKLCDPNWLVPMINKPWADVSERFV